MEVQPLEEQLTVDSIMNGEVQVTDSVNKFLTDLYTGNTSEISKRKQRFIDSTVVMLLLEENFCMVNIWLWLLH